MRQELYILYKQLAALPWSKRIVAIPFFVCALFLLFIGKTFKLTYKEISVVFNLWIQGAVLMLSSFLPLVACVIVLTKGISLWTALLTLFFFVYAIINIWAFIGMLKHYGKNKDYAFDLCVNDLMRIAASWGMSYHMVNLLIFILFYLMIIGINLILAHYVLLRW